MRPTSKLRLLFIWVSSTIALMLLFGLVGPGDSPVWLEYLVSPLVGFAAVAYHEKLYGFEAMKTWLFDGSAYFLRMRSRAAKRWGQPVDKECAEIALAYVDTIGYQWDRALERTDDVSLDDAVPEQAELFGFFAAYCRYSALLFTERIEEARAVFDGDIMPHTGTAEPGDPGRLALMARSCLGELLYCEGEHVKAWDALYESLHAVRLPRFARARGLYFAGRIVLDRGQKPLAWQHFRAAIDTAPDTFVPHAIEALARELERDSA